MKKQVLIEVVNINNPNEKAYVQTPEGKIATFPDVEQAEQFLQRSRKSLRNGWAHICHEAMITDES